MDFLDPIFNMHKIKFDVLDKWGLVDKKTSRVNVYINLENVFKFIITPRINNFIQAASSMEGYESYMKKVSLSLVSNIINLGQHYRLWLAKQNIDSRIILYWNYPCPGEYINSKYIQTYRSTHQDRYCSNMESSHILECLTNAYKFLNVCIHYINEVYLIDAGRVESSLVPLIVSRYVYDNTTVKNLLVTTSKYEYSYTDYGFTIISPSVKKKNPYIVNNRNVVEVLKGKTGVTTTLSSNSNFIEFINAAMGCSDRNIAKMSGIGMSSILKMINVAIQKGLITENTKDIDMLSGIIGADFKDLFIRNYHCTNLELQIRDIEPIDIHRIKSQIVDKYDEATLNAMNEKYFKLFPIEIIKPRSQQVLYDNDNGKSLFS